MDAFSSDRSSGENPKADVPEAGNANGTGAAPDDADEVDEPSESAPASSDPGQPASEADPSGDADDLEDRSATLGAVREPQRLHPLTLLLRILSSLPALLLVAFPLIQNPGAQNVFPLVMTVLYGVLALPAIVLQYLRYSYRITPKQIVIQQGVFNRQNRSIPIERVQNIQIEQNLAARVFGISKVQLETAGSTSTEGTLEYVSLHQAHEIRSLVRSFQRQQKKTADAESAGPDAATPDDADAAQDAGAEELFRMSLPRVLTSGAFRFSLLYIAVIFSAFQFLQPESLVDWMMASRGELEGWTETALAHPAIAALGTIVLAALFGWLSGIMLHLNRYYGFRLWLEDDKLRKRHGLLTVTEGTIPLKKVQALILKTNPLMRAFGWFELEVQTVGVNVNEQGHRVIVPFAQYEDVLRTAHRVRDFELPGSFTSVSPLTIRRRFVRYSMTLTAFAGLAAYFWPADWLHPSGAALPWWALTLIPFLGVWAYLQYRHHDYEVSEDGFYVRRGVLSQILWIIPTEKHHVFTSTASLFQRRLGLASLYVDTAGASARAYPEVIDLPADAAGTHRRGLYDRFRTLYRNRIRAATGSPDRRLSEEERPQLGEGGPGIGDADAMRATEDEGHGNPQST